jgi:hypothetical protein
VVCLPTPSSYDDHNIFKIQATVRDSSTRYSSNLAYKYWTNALAYYAAEMIMALKSFMIQATGGSIDPGHVFSENSQNSNNSTMTGAEEN